MFHFEGSIKCKKDHAGSSLITLILSLSLLTLANRSQFFCSKNEKSNFLFKWKMERFLGQKLYDV